MARPSFDFISSCAKGFSLPRDYDSRTYFAVELENGIEPVSFAKANGWKFEHKVGELKDHYLYSVESESGGDITRRELGSALHDLIKLGGINMDHANDDRLESSTINDLLISREIDDETSSQTLKNKLLSTGVKLLHPLSLQKLERRAPVPIIKSSDDISLFSSSLENRESPGTAKNPLQEAMGIVDPQFNRQWHLYNAFYPGNDVNISGLWAQNITGKGVITAIVDDGLDHENPDIKANYFAEGSYDYNDLGPDPAPKLVDDHHGTRCAGEIGAVKNNVCGVGVAFDSKISGIRILSGKLLEVDEAAALNYAMDKQHIYSCSWGPSDNGQSMSAPPEIVKRAMINGVVNGRDEKGSIFVFASGNGGVFGDNCNFDGYTNSIYSITVAAIDHKNLHPSYSESCSANMVVTYSSGSGENIYTTDMNNKCTNMHGGTSAAAPLAAGIFALVLQVRPDITWRDLQYLVVNSAVPIHEAEHGWQTTAYGKKFSHTYGYGKIDAGILVENAKDWELVKPQAWYFPPVKKTNAEIMNPKLNERDELEAKTESVITISKDDLNDANLSRVEHITVTVNIAAERRGEIAVMLESPDKILSELAPFRIHDKNTKGFANWTFMSVAHWGESGVGDWKLTVTAKNGEAEFVDWSLKLWGESIDARKAKVFPLDGNVDKDLPSVKLPGNAADDGKSSQVSTYNTASSSTLNSASTKISSIGTSIGTSTDSLITTSVPSSDVATSSTTSEAQENTASSSIPAPVKSSDYYGSDEDKESDKAGENEDSSGLLGLSQHTITVIYGGFLLFVGFMGCVGIYMCLTNGNAKSRKKRTLVKNRVTTNDAYEFDLISAEEDSDIDDNDVEGQYYERSDRLDEFDPDAESLTSLGIVDALSQAQGNRSQGQSTRSDNDDAQHDLFTNKAKIQDVNPNDSTENATDDMFLVDSDEESDGEAHEGSGLISVGEESTSKP
ncbi:hypothetical protein NADFUDRAFT_74391 [Nadsonia fulvescens var. elongata DSM 6958]|uniref:P/Homo B domain-containing protein n=1 Tax=Nadsonia fulvescens var. elongata DSM 6958 TaxID=857566 RepID=A0A1E3PL06_9ASCO|nr:hypothetical protein NADFUDRAFT_74391 [Nadsonia fulvescens var. elongata DSM 6958]